MANELLFDSWTSLSFKRALGNTRVGGRSWTAPTWVGDRNRRRLTAYTILQAYLDNAAREFLEVTDEEDRDNHREYGDAALLRNQILSALLGDTQVIYTPGSENYDASRAFASPTGAENADNTQAPNTPEATTAWQFQSWARAWAGEERFPSKLIECERTAVGLGDGVYTVGWNPRKRRVRLRVWNPGFYFPDLDTLDEDDYPTRVHIAWEEEQYDERGNLDQSKIKLRRITWELGLLPEGQTRRLPWNDEPVNYTCYMSDGTWLLRSDLGRSVNDLDMSTAEWATWAVDPETGEDIPWRNIDLGIDFLPVVHEPNTVAEEDHFGQSAIAKVLQILDDVANADTDLAAASSTAGAPVIALSGGTLKDEPSYKPGSVFSLAEGGRMAWMDTSKGLDALIKYVQNLLERLQINSRVPSAVVGRLKPSEVPSGIALALSFGPLRSMIDEMRLVRHDKLSLLFKFAWRLSYVNMTAEQRTRANLPPKYLPTHVVMGSFLPNDVAAAVEAIYKLAQSRALSFETAVQMLVEAGLPIPDAQEEVRRIQSRDFEQAKQFFQASGSDHGAVMEYLGRKSINPPPDPAEVPGSPLDADKDGVINEPGFE